MKQKITHRNIGICFITDESNEMQKDNPDPTSIYVEHDDEIKEVSRSMIVEFAKFTELESL